jgi:hypothetical protein
MFRDVMDHFAATGRVADMDGIFQIQELCKFRNVCGMSIHVMPGGSLGRPSMTSAIMRNNAVAVIEEKHHLPVPVIA